MPPSSESLHSCVNNGVHEAARQQKCRPRHFALNPHERLLGIPLPYAGQEDEEDDNEGGEVMRWFFRRRCGHQIPGIHPGVGVRSPYNGQTEGPHRVQRVQDRPMRNEAPRTMGHT